jgi:DNA polymerase (family X)
VDDGEAADNRKVRPAAHDGRRGRESVTARSPYLIRRLIELGAASAAETRLLVDTLGVLTLADLQVALDDGRVTRTGGNALAARLLYATQGIESDILELPLGRARDLLDGVISAIAAVAPEVGGLSAGGGVRRFESIVSELAVAGCADDPQAALDAIAAAPDFAPVLHCGDRRAVVTFQHAEIDLHIAAADEYGTALVAATGSSAHVAALHRRRGSLHPLRREIDVYHEARLDYIAPELRQGTGEIEAGAAGELPALVTREQVRGDLHMHTNYSDGADSLAVMVEQCRVLGYEYIAITDHSERAAASRTLARRDVARQADDIAAMRERHPQIAILHGIEADIMPDGSLDFPDRVLEQFDIVLASMHDPARQDPRTLTERCITAIRHPLVTIITHPSNRLVGKRAGYALDWEAIYAAAAETGTVLEVDGAPSHLDLDGEHARAAVSAGVTLSIDSDCHRARLLRRQMELGIGTARRGWVEARHVLNARPLEEVRAFIRRKRSGAAGEV